MVEQQDMGGDEMATIRAAKSRLRQSIQVSLRQLQPADVSAQTSRALSALFSMPEYQAARNISVYLSMPSGEISTGEIVRSALRDGRSVFVPYLYKSSIKGKPRYVMDMVALDSEADYDAMKPDKWGIPSVSSASVSGRTQCLGIEEKPAEEETRPLLNRLDLIVVPGVAFDQRLQRLGHGKGFYDSFFSSYRARVQLSDHAQMPHLVALVLEEQILPPEESVPITHTDWPVDTLIGGDGKLQRRPS